MEDLSEKEQLDALRAWWSENGTFVVSGIVLGIVLLGGFNYWRSSVESARTSASALYEEVMRATGDGDVDDALAAANRIFDEYENTPYASQSRLALARLYMDMGRDEDAANALRELVANDPDSELALVGRLRLAKILLYQDKPEEAVALLDGPMDHAFASRYHEVLGDAWVAMEEYEKAEAAYVAALNDDPVARTVDFNIIQLKINDLPAADASSPDTAVVPPEPALEEAAEALVDEVAEQAGTETEGTE